MSSTKILLLPFVVLACDLGVVTKPTFNATPQLPIDEPHDTVPRIGFPDLPGDVQIALAEELKQFIPQENEVTPVAYSEFLTDSNNLCVSAPPATSTNVVLPQDYQLHYTLNPPNYDPSLGDAAAAFESDFKRWFLTVVPTSGGSAAKVYIHRIYFAFQLAPFFWAKAAAISITSPDLGIAYTEFVPLEFGLFSEIPNGYEFLLQQPDSLGNPVTVAQAIKQPNGQSYDLIDLNVMGFPLSFEAWDKPLKNPNFPFQDGKGAYTDADTSEVYAVGRYHANPFQISGVQLAIAGEDYIGAGRVWNERQWAGIDQDGPGTDVLGEPEWQWLALQVLGCITENGQKVPCSLTGQTIAGFDIYTKGKGANARTSHASIMHALDMVTAWPNCSHIDRDEYSDWSITGTDFFTSSLTGRTYPVGWDFNSPTDNMYLEVASLIPNQEASLGIQFVYPGTYAGTVTFEGTFGNQTIYGEGSVELFQWGTLP